MKRSDLLGPAALDVLIEEITVDAYGDAEQLWAFRHAFDDNVPAPCEGSVIGEPVTVMKCDYDGNERLGLTAKCRRADGSVYTIAAADVSMAPDTDGARYLAAYRKWMGLPPLAAARPRIGSRIQTSPLAVGIDPGRPLELAVLSVKQTAARCRIVGGGQTITLRAGRLWDLVPGEIAVVRPSKQWSYAGHPYLSGSIESTRVDLAALALIPLSMEERGVWDPDQHYWGEEGDPIEDWAKPIIARGPRPEFEMEQVLPGEDPDDPFNDPIIEANDRKDAGDFAGAHKLLMELCQADLRCLDAHAHLGNLVFDRRPKDAIRHYEVGFRIGGVSLGERFEGVLPWGWIDNRPFLRCMNGFGLCLWRLGRFEEAERIFDRMLWLNPSDNQGVRSLIGPVRARAPWKDHEEVG